MQAIAKFWLIDMTGAPSDIVSKVTVRKSKCYLESLGHDLSVRLRNSEFANYKLTYLLFLEVIYQDDIIVKNFDIETKPPLQSYF